jgi:hypothetical protein
MADNFTHFSCVLDVGTPENAARVLELYPAFLEKAARGGAFAGGFLVSLHPDGDGTKIWMRDDVTGDPLQVIVFVERCAEVFGLKGRWGFQWALCRYRHKAHYAVIQIMPSDEGAARRDLDMRISRVRHNQWCSSNMEHTRDQFKSSYLR